MAQSFDPASSERAADCPEQCWRYYPYHEDGAAGGECWARMGQISPGRTGAVRQTRRDAGSVTKWLGMLPQGRLSDEEKLGLLLDWDASTITAFIDGAKIGTAAAAALNLAMWQLTTPPCASENFHRVR